MGKNNLSTCLRIQKTKWTISETEKLCILVKVFKSDWIKIAAEMKTKSSSQCIQKYRNDFLVKVKGSWTQEEDEKLKRWVKLNGEKRWRKCAELILGRCGKQCRERWINVLNPRLKKGDWTFKEQEQLFQLTKILFSKWTLIRNKMNLRSENCLKNYFYSSIRKIKSSSFFKYFQLIVMTEDLQKNKIDEDSFLKKMPINLFEEEILKMNHLSKQILLCFFSQHANDKHYIIFLEEVLFDVNSISFSYINNNLFKTFSGIVINIIKFIVNKENQNPKNSKNNK